ncbi:MAG: hypothetical protein ABSA39_01290 [Edaphobacter sp.]
MSVSAPMAAKNIYVIRFSSTDDVEQDSVAVFPASASGSTTPTSTLMLPSGFVDLALAVGPTGVIYVGGQQQGSEQGFGQILEYAAGSSGSATPSVTLNGSAASTATFTYPSSLAVNSAGMLFIASADRTLEAFASGFTASSAPTQYLTWGQVENNNGDPNFGDPSGSIGADTAGNLFYLDEGNGQIDVFAAGATGATAPVRTISGTDTTYFTELEYLAVDGAGDVYVTNYNQANDPNANARTNPVANAANRRVQAMVPGRARPSIAYPHITALPPEPTGIIEFAALATGAATPVKRIGGAGGVTPNNTGIVEPANLVLDAASNLYYQDANGGVFGSGNTMVLLEVFPPSATGNATPAASFTSTNFLFDNSGPVAVF